MIRIATTIIVVYLTIPIAGVAAQEDLHLSRLLARSPSSDRAVPPGG